MRELLRGWGWVGLGLLMFACVVCGAQTVTTTNEVRAMRGLGPVEVAAAPAADERLPGTPAGMRDEGSGVEAVVERTSALVG